MDVDREPNQKALEMASIGYWNSKDFGLEQHGPV
jgi:hypothetical protein